jgi:hypothetical protein
MFLTKVDKLTGLYLSHRSKGSLYFDLQAGTAASLGYNRTRKSRRLKTILGDRVEISMNLPSHHQSQEKDWPIPSGTPTSAGHRQSTDGQSSTLDVDNEQSVPTKTGLRPASWKSFLVLGAVSLGLHLLALRIPVPAIQAVSKVNQPIKVTRLAVAPKPKRLPPRSIPKPSAPQTSVKSEASQRSSGLPNPSVNRAAIAPTRQPSSPSVAPSSPKAPASQASPSSPPAPNPDQKLEPDFKDFPTYPGSALSSESSVSTTTDDFKKVADYFDKVLLSDQKQKWSSQGILNESSGVKAYQVHKGGVKKILSVFSKGPLGTAYILTDRPTTLDALEKAEEAIASISDILGGLKALEQVDGSRTAQPTLFKRDDPEILSMNLIEVAPPEKVFADYFSTPLAQNGFEVPKPSAYGGGPVYVLNRGQFTGYLNLVPSQDGKGTVIIFWKVHPA